MFEIRNQIPKESGNHYSLTIRGFNWCKDANHLCWEKFFLHVWEAKKKRKCSRLEWQDSRRSLSWTELLKHRSKWKSCLKLCSPNLSDFWFETTRDLLLPLMRVTSNSVWAPKGKRISRKRTNCLVIDLTILLKRPEYP